MVDNFTLDLAEVPEGGGTVHQVQVVANTRTGEAEAVVQYTTPEGEDLQLRQPVELNFTRTNETVGDILTADTLREAIDALNAERLDRPWRFDPIPAAAPEEGWPAPPDNWQGTIGNATVQRYICGNGHIYPAIGIAVSWPGTDVKFCAQCVGEFLAEQIPNGIQQPHDVVPWDVAYPPPPPDELYNDDEEVTGNTTTTGIGGTTYFEAHHDEPLIGGTNGLREE